MSDKISVRSARTNACLTQLEMAERLKISIDTYRKYEKQPEKMPIAVAFAFCDVVQRDFAGIIFLP